MEAKGWFKKTIGFTTGGIEAAFFSPMRITHQSERISPSSAEKKTSVLEHSPSPVGNHRNADLQRNLQSGPTKTQHREITSVTHLFSAIYRGPMSLHVTNDCRAPPCDLDQTFIIEPSAIWNLVLEMLEPPQLSHKKNPCYFPLYWLVNRDPYNGLL